MNCFLIRVRITATEAIRTRPKRTADTEGEEVTLEEPGDRRRLTNMGELRLCTCYVEHVSKTVSCVRRDAEHSLTRLVQCLLRVSVLESATGVSSLVSPSEYPSFTAVAFRRLMCHVQLYKVVSFLTPQSP